MLKGLLLNLRTLLAAAVLGVLVWYISRNEMTRTEEVRAFVRVEDARDCRIEGETGQAPVVRVMLSGPSVPLERLRGQIERQDVVGHVRVTPQQIAAGGTIVVPVTESMFGTLDDSRLRVRLVDREVRLVITPLARRLLPVQLDTDLDPTRIRAQVLSPQTVEVRGPKALLDKLTDVKTERLALKALVDAGRTDIQIGVGINRTVDGLRSAIECDERIWVNVLVGEEMVDQTIENVPVALLVTPGFAYDVRIAKAEERTATLVVRAPRSVLLRIPDLPKRVLVFAAVDSPDLKPRETPYPIERRCVLPEGVQKVSITGADKVNVDILERKPAPGPVTP